MHDTLPPELGLAGAQPVRRVLVVDDDPRVLRGLQGLLRRLADRWQITFVNSGAAAIEALDRESFDVVVSDLHMPQVDGHAVLLHTRMRHPGAARVVLTGAAEMINVAHQIVMKPCPRDVLCGVVENALHGLAARAG